MLCFVSIQILKLYTGLVGEKVLFFVFSVMEGRPVYSNVPIMKLKCVTVIIMRMPELVVVISHCCDISSVGQRFFMFFYQLHLAMRVKCDYLMAEFRSVTMKCGDMCVPRSPIIIFFIHTQMTGLMMMQVQYVGSWDSLFKVNIIFTCHTSFYIYFTGAQGSYEYNNYRTFPFFLRGPNCTGNEEHLVDCPNSEIENITSCYRTSIVHCPGEVWGLLLLLLSSTQHLITLM